MKFSGNSALKSRILRGVGATAMGPVITVIIQVGTVPLLIHAWGATKYGDWLLLSAVPSYFSLSDLGFSDVSSSDMTMRVAAGDREGALRTFHSCWALLFPTSLAIIAIAAATFGLAPWQSWLHLSGVSSRAAAAVMFTLVSYMAISQQSGILESGFRCEGNYALGIFSNNLVRLGETLLSSTIGIVTGNFLYMAIALLVGRVIGILCSNILLRRKRARLRVGVSKARWASIKELTPPALGFIAIPLAYSFSLQGFTIAVGAVLGPRAVTGFATLRTLTRMSAQALNAIGFTIWPELSTAFGAGNLELARRLHRRTYQIGLAISLAIAAGLWIVGPTIYRLWIRNAVPFDPTTFHILIAVTFVFSLWFISSVVPMSTNAHQRIAYSFVAVSVSSLALARFVMIPLLGTPGAAWSLLLIDLAMTWIVLRKSLRLLGDTLPSFLSAVLRVPKLSTFAIRTDKDLESVSGS